MPFKSISILALMAALLVPARLHAEPTADSPTAQMKAVVTQVQAKAQAGKKAEADYTNELATLESLIAGAKTAKTDEAVQFTYMKAMLYVEVIKDFDKASSILRQISTNYPNTEYSRSAESLLPLLDQMTAQMSMFKKMQARFPTGSAFPDFSTTNMNGGALSVSALTNKVVLVDFWATWCPPCRAEVPKVIETYQKYHAQGFEIIGISHDSERSELEAFLNKQPGMTWPQYFDSRGPNNPISAKFEVSLIPFTILIGPDGRILGSGLRGEELQAAVAKAVTDLASQK